MANTFVAAAKFVEDFAQKYAFARPMIAEFAEQMRQEGRLEILLEIAAMKSDDPRTADSAGYHCVFCDEGDINPHAVGCLWVRAQEAQKQAK